MHAPARRAVRVPDAIADGCEKNADRGYHYRMDLAVSSGSDDHDSGSGPSQPGTDRSCGASLVHALAHTCRASPAWWNQSYPQVGLRRVIGGAAPVEWRGREGANLRDRLTLAAKTGHRPRDPEPATSTRYSSSARRQAPGLMPTVRVKTRVRWLWSEKPQVKATSNNDNRPSRS